MISKVWGRSIFSFFDSEHKQTREKCPHQYDWSNEEHCICLVQAFFNFILYFLSSFFFMSKLITELKPIDLSLAETKRALIAVSPTVSIQTALNLMSNNKITSLPIYSHRDTDIVSIINLLDILLYLVQDKQLKLHDPVENILGLDNDRESYRMHKTDRTDKLAEVINKWPDSATYFH